jgi:hypothetical protein
MPRTSRSHRDQHTIIHLRDVLGDEAYESLVRAGENMTNAAMAAYAFDQIEQARADLLHA